MKIKLNNEWLIFLVFILSLSFISLLALSFFESNLSKIPLLKSILFYIVFFCSLSVFAVIGVYYLSKIFLWLGKGYLRLYFAIAILLGLFYAIFTGLKENSWLTFLANCAYSGLVIIGLPLIAKVIKKSK